MSEGSPQTSKRTGAAKSLLTILACFLFLLFSTLCRAESPAKEALLIANGNYTHFPKLKNPPLDARLLSKALIAIGFKVKLVENATREQMLDEIGFFENRLKSSKAIAFFHYGGHGLQVGGRNYLIPTDANIPDEKRVATRAVELEELMSALDASQSSANIVVLDACRDNPLPSSSDRSLTRGLSAVQKKPKNSVVIYAAEAGTKAQDGLFTPVLADALTSPGLSLSEIMTRVRREVYELSKGAQTPGEYNQLFDQIYLASASNSPSGDTSPTKTSASLPAIEKNSLGGKPLQTNPGGDLQAKPLDSSLWRKTRTTRFGVILSHPESLVREALGEEQSGVRSASPTQSLSEDFFSDGQMRIAVTAFLESDPSILEKRWMKEIAERGPSITYKVKRSDWYVVSGVDKSGHEFYSKFWQLRGGRCFAFGATYPHSLNAHYDAVIERMLRDFSPVFSDSPQAVNLGSVFTNSLGQKFVPISGTSTYFSIWSTRVSDYTAFVKATGRTWKPAGFLQKADHPAVRVSHQDATTFCNWLTETEHRTGKLPGAYVYRLPTDREWSAAAGIHEQTEGPPAWRSGAIANLYPWGKTWPPPPGRGNYDPRLRADPYPYTSPVGSFAPNACGLYDMSGNVLQWIQEDFDESGQGFLRGSSWPDETPNALNLTSRVNDAKTNAHKCYGFRCVIGIRE